MTDKKVPQNQSFTTRRFACSGQGRRKVAQIADVIRVILNGYPEFKKIKVTEGGGGMGGASTVDVEVYGYDFEATDRLAREIQAKMLEDGGCSQVLLSRDEYIPEYQVDFDRTKLAVNGLNSTTAAAYLSAAMNGSTQVQTYFQFAPS